MGEGKATGGQEGAWPPAPVCRPAISMKCRDWVFGLVTMSYGLPSISRRGVLSPPRSALGYLRLLNGNKRNPYHLVTALVMVLCRVVGPLPRLTVDVNIVSAYAPEQGHHLVRRQRGDVLAADFGGQDAAPEPCRDDAVWPDWTASICTAAFTDRSGHCHASLAGQGPRRACSLRAAPDGAVQCAYRVEVVGLVQADAACGECRAAFTLSSD